jgi:hypothetical protein
MKTSYNTTAAPGMKRPPTLRDTMRDDLVALPPGAHEAIDGQFIDYLQDQFPDTSDRQKLMAALERCSIVHRSYVRDRTQETPDGRELHDAGMHFLELVTKRKSALCDRMRGTPRFGDPEAEKLEELITLIDLIAHSEMPLFHTDKRKKGHQAEQRSSGDVGHVSGPLEERLRPGIHAKPVLGEG